MSELPLEKLREYRLFDNTIIRGDIPNIEFGENYIIEKVFISIFIFVFSAFIFCSVLGGLFSLVSLGALGFVIGLSFACFLVCLYLFYPVLYVHYIEFKTKEKPEANILDRFNNRYKSVKEFLIRNNFVTPSKSHKEEAKAISINRSDKSAFRLWLGVSTGQLVKLWHKPGLAQNQHVSLDLEDACQNILVLGGIGSGKTTCIMQPVLLQCLDQKCGGLIFDIKGDVKKAVIQFAEATKKNLIVLGPKHHKINLLDGLTPEVAASFLKSAFLLNEKGHLDSFWIDTATELCRNTLGMLSFIPQHYSLQGLYQYLFDPETKDDIDDAIDKLLPRLEPNQNRLLKTYRRYHETIFANFDTKIKSGVNATVAQALSPFSHPELLDAFCSTKSAMVKMEDLVAGSVCLVDIPLSVWGLGGKVAYTFIKLRFFNLMQHRNQLEVNQEHPVFFMCDEFQEIVSANREGLSDLSFWDKSRSSKTIGIISSQSIASFYAALGNRDTAHALLQNFRQKLCLRTEDPITLDFMEKLVGKAKVKKLSVTRGYNSDDVVRSHKSSTQYSSNTISEVRENVVDAQLFRELNPAQAVAILSLGGQSMDDVLSLMPVYSN